jgi:hypothetical protein
MSWDGELRQERKELDDRLWISRQTNLELRRELRALRKYIEELEKALEPCVLAEIRGELEAQKEREG